MRALYFVRPQFSHSVVLSDSDLVGSGSGQVKWTPGSAILSSNPFPDLNPVPTGLKYKDHFGREVSDMSVYRILLLDVFAKPKCNFPQYK